MKGIVTLFVLSSSNKIKQVYLNLKESLGILFFFSLQFEQAFFFNFLLFSFHFDLWFDFFYFDQTKKN
jgi:hypothetical protein